MKQRRRLFPPSPSPSPHATALTLHPFSTAMAAMLSPSRAHRMDAPPSTTRTRPSPFSSRDARTRGLFSKHLTVAARPEKAVRPP